MCAAALAHILPQDIEITFIQTPDADKTDVFYGSVTSPTAYAFLLSIGISEPELLLRTGTTFSLGTEYVNWGPQARSWTQSFHLPLPVFEGVDFHHHVLRHHRNSDKPVSLEPYIMSVQAAQKSVFAHPPSGRKIPLADMEYGYNFSPAEWADIFSGLPSLRKIKQITGAIEDIQYKDGDIASVALADGQRIEADLFIDCTGPIARLSSGLKSRWSGERRLRAVSHLNSEGKPHGTCRILTGSDHGWHAKTPLRSGTHHLEISSPETENTDLLGEDATDANPVDLRTGRTSAPWQGNCISFGHAAAVIEPLTPAPMMMLEHDIKRLLELIPVSKDMKVESREYNRRFNDDHTHAELFQRSFFACDKAPDTDYWKAAQSQPAHEKLTVKIDQFKSRGILVRYDHEPFNAQDWVMLHFGLGHIPKRYDILAERIPLERLEKQLEQMRMAIANMAKKLPPHNIYMSKLLNYLKEQNG